jgi:hypothetical protein
VVDHCVDVAAVDIDMSSGPEAGLKQRVGGAAITIYDVGTTTRVTSSVMNSRRLVCRERSIVRGDGGWVITRPP